MTKVSLAGSLTIIYSSSTSLKLKNFKIYKPKSLETWNCSSSAGSTLAVFCLVRYFFSTFFVHFLLKTASSPSVYNKANSSVNNFK
jgi:hypothetical protein